MSRMENRNCLMEANPNNINSLTMIANPRVRSSNLPDRTIASRSKGSRPAISIEPHNACAAVSQWRRGVFAHRMARHSVFALHVTQWRFRFAAPGPGDRTTVGEPASPGRVAGHHTSSARRQDDSYVPPDVSSARPPSRTALSVNARNARKGRRPSLAPVRIRSDRSFRTKLNEIDGS